MNNFVSVILWELLGMISLLGVSGSANPNRKIKYNQNITTFKKLYYKNIIIFIFCKRPILFFFSIFEDMAYNFKVDVCILLLRDCFFYFFKHVV